MKYENVIEGTFIKRENRFISLCRINGIIEKVYVPNTGRCEELFVEGRKVYLTKHNDPNRKTKFTLIHIYKKDLLINIDSQAPNKIVEEALIKKDILKEYNLTRIKRESTYGNSRFDFYLEGFDDKDKPFKGYLEVKGVTLENNGHSMFPDAPTLRGLKHLKELSIAKQDGYYAFVVFVIQMNPIIDFIPNTKMQEDFSKELKLAINNGVHCLCFQCDVKKDTVNFLNEIPLGNF